MRIGYNTNGFAHHQIEDAITILADVGYRSIAITLDHHTLNPDADDFSDQCRRVRALLDERDLHCVVETGARFLLDACRKHWPTLLDHSSEDRSRRFDFLNHAVDLAAALDADAVSFWSGTKPPDLPDDRAMTRLADACRRLALIAEEKNVRLAFEPEPGMFIDTMTRFAELHARADRPNFGLTLDVGHAHCLDDGRITDHLEAWSPHLFNVHIEDMRSGTHDHLMFGQGEIDFPPVIATLGRIGYPFGIHVELPRHSHNAVATAREAYAFLTDLEHD